MEPVGQRGRQPQDRASISEAAEPGRKHSSTSDESCRGCGSQMESSSAPEVLNCIKAEANVATPKASR